MFESELKMKIGGISDEGGKKSRMLDKSVNPEEKKLLERNEIREEIKTEMDMRVKTENWEQGRKDVSWK